MINFFDTGLKEFPFRDVPPNSPTDLWVGRPKFLDEINQIVSSWSYNLHSGIFFIWADFGAGKTHALRYIEHLVSTKQSSSIAIYCEMPKAITQFKFIFEQIMPRFSDDILCNSIRDYRQKYGTNWLSAQILNGDRDTPRVLWTLAQTIEQPQSEIARKWLRGERLSSAELRTIDNVTPIKTSDQATKVLGTLCRIILQSSRYSRVVIMLDEFQRIGQSTKKYIAEINDSIHTLFNSCPEGLSILLTYSIGVPDSIKYLTSNAVRSRLRGIYTLLAMTKVETKEFIAELLNKYRLPESQVQVFSDDAIDWMTTKLFEDNDNKVTPRIAMQGFSKILEKTLNGKGPDHFPIDKTWAKKLYDPQAYLINN